MEYVIVGVVVAAAAAYVGLRIFRRISGKGGCDCGRPDGCSPDGACGGYRGGKSLR